MRFCDYLRFLHSYVGTDRTQADFVIYITTMFLRETITDEEKQDDEKDLYNPLNQLKWKVVNHKCLHTFLYLLFYNYPNQAHI